MARPNNCNNNNNKLSFITVPSPLPSQFEIIHQPFLNPKSKNHHHQAKNSFLHLRNPKLWLLCLFIFSFFGLGGYNVIMDNPFSSNPCLQSLQILKSQEMSLMSGGRVQNLDDTEGRRRSEIGGVDQPISGEYVSQSQDDFEVGGVLSEGTSIPLSESRVGVSGVHFDGTYLAPSGGVGGVHLERDQEMGSDGKGVGVFINETKGEGEGLGFWEQPNGLGYTPCLEFTKEYKGMSEVMVKDRSKFLLVVVSGGLNQQRNQIVDAVVIARILGAALVVPILQVNVIWGDESEFSDIFDLEHFKSVLADDVHIVSSLPSTHLMSRPVEEKRTPPNVSPRWIRERYSKRLRRDGVLLLRGLDSRLSKDLPSDLQKLRCKVAFHALRFSPPILELGTKLTQRMRSKGPYIALHLRMEKDVWVRTGCLPGLSRKYDEIIRSERKLRPELLTGRSNMSSHDRKLAGLCPMNALDVTRLLKALGAPRNAKIYWAGGSPFGGQEALVPLTKEFPYFYNKEDLAQPGELEPFKNKASFLAALDYIVSEDSDVFMPSHGGNMGHAIQGHRAYAGHKKYITPNKRQMLPFFLNASLPEPEFNKIIRELHKESLGQPDLRRSKTGRDVTKYPIPGCMCNDTVTRMYST